MADNVTPEATVSGATFKFRTDDLGGSPTVQAPVSKILLGGDGTDDGFVSSANPMPISDASGSITVDNATLSVTGGGVEASAIRVTVASDSTGVLSIDDNGGSLTVDNGGTFAVQASQSGTWTVGLSAAQTLATVTTVGTVTTITNVVHVDDNSGSLTVDAPVGTPVFVRLSDGASAISTLPVSLASVPSHNVTNAGTFAVQATVAAGATTIAKAEDVASADADVGVPAMAVRKATPANTSGTDGDYEMLQMSAGRLWVSAAVDTALPAGTNAIGKLASNTGVTIGAVEIAAAQTLATVTTVSTVTTCSTVTTLTGGGVAHDGVDSGNPVKVGGRAVSSLASATMVAAADRSDLVTDLDGALIVRLNRPGGDTISERVTNTDGTSTAFSNFGAVASTRNVITSISLYNSSATAGFVDFRDGTAGSVLWTMAIPATGGSIISAPQGLFRTSANTALAYDVSGALSTVYISVSGHQSKT